MSINVDRKNRHYASEDGALFNKGKTELFCVPGGKTGTYMIPNSVTSIGDWAFIGCADLTSVIIPRNVKKIGSGAFGTCLGLTTITIPSGVNNIDDGAFTHCENLVSVYFEGNAPSMGKDVFRKTADEFTIYYRAGTSGWSNPWNGYPTQEW